MREIKFRAVIPTVNKMCFKGRGLTLNEIRRLGEGYFREDVIWLEFTGLKDKNGIEIYEGDIVNLMPQGFAILPAITQWSSKELRWVCHRPETDTGFYLTSDSEFEVIGNKYENPELLGS